MEKSLPPKSPLAPLPRESPPAPLPSRLEKHRAAVVVIDVQERFRDLIVDIDTVVTGCSRLIQFGQRLEIPVLVTEHYPRGLGTTFRELQMLFDDWRPIEKIAFSCCGCGVFNEALAGLGRDQIVLVGIETHVCVYQTAFDLLHAGYQVAVAGDAVSSRRTHDRELGLRRMEALGAQIMSTEMILFEILREAKTDDFKAVADILRE
jgi:nicotinamidase-related amidase